jgi:hypothetical protein
MSDKHSSIISVRVSDEVKNALILESELEGVTLNTMIGKILLRHVEWDQFSAGVGFVMTTKPFLRNVLDTLSDVELKKLAMTICRTAFVDAVIFITGSLTIVNFLKVLQLWLSVSRIHFRHVLQDGKDKFIVQHELGEKWSLYFSTLMGSILNEIGYRPVDIASTQQSISFVIEKV